MKKRGFNRIYQESGNMRMLGALRHPDEDRVHPVLGAFRLRGKSIPPLPEAHTHAWFFLKKKLAN